MRKEDKVRLPPPLVLALPPDFRVDRRPGGYAVFLRYRWGSGWGEDLVCTVGLGNVPDVEAFVSGEVAEVTRKLASPEGWRGIRQTPYKPEGAY